MDEVGVLKALKQAWRMEMEGAVTYRALAEREEEGGRKAILERLAEMEQDHAARWEKRIEELGGEPPDRSTVKSPLGPSLHLAKPEVIMRRLEAQEEEDIAAYERLLEEVGDEESHRIARDAILDEQEHARTLHFLAGPPHGPARDLDRILRREKWHVRSGSWIGDAIYGVNDGLGAVFGIVSGVAGATHADHRYVVLAGVAGTFASALSMGSGAYLAAKSEREVYEGELHRERKELEENPEEEREELELFYQLKGFTPEEARMLTDRLAQQPEQMLKMLAHEELGLVEGQLPNPWVSGLSATLSTAVGAFIPLIPFFFMRGLPALVASGIVSILGHFAVGAAKSLVTTRSWWASGLEMTFVGILVGAVTYFVGVLLGVG
ncbi:MAG: VIT1/CCC1 transporter family protein [Armatimonadetes bacterium]|nr:VIT1/CCC1 transporter family protein [Armatimonadota bacterium]